MSDVIIIAGGMRFAARFEETTTPRTCAALRRLLPFVSQIVHVRWSGEAVWVPMGDMDLGLTFERSGVRRLIERPVVRTRGHVHHSTTTSY